MRIVVAMSGGVDSSVAAARLHAQGHEVVGVTLHLWDYPEDAQPQDAASSSRGVGANPHSGPTASRAHGRCCAPEDQYDARRTADRVGFAHYTFDRRQLFAEKIVAPFVDAYVGGDTPSPCTTCNREVKLRELMAIADRLGAEKVATGHYARILRDERGAPFLARGVDASKDQSYFLYACTREHLERLMFPLGESTKADVRSDAVRLGLPGATKGESQELCFVGSGAGAYASFVEERAASRIRPGPIVDETGRVIGEHAGVHRFTVGQRKGLGVALGKPAFVTRIDATTSTVHLGSELDLETREAKVEDVVLAPDVSLPLRARVRVRYRHDGADADVQRCGSGARVSFLEPVRAVTRGQIAVFYDRDRVLGGGRIATMAG
jgi:tRNA-specific 2-thiouridylase